MPVPTNLDDLDPMPSNNSPDGAEAVFPLLNDHIQAAYAFIAQVRDRAGAGVSSADLASTAAGKGAEMVAFKQSGTGAVDRTALDKLREFVSVRDFGAVGDGAADDTAAINAALASGAKRIHMPAGAYRVTAMVDVPNFVTLYGDGMAVAPGQAATRIIKHGDFLGLRLNVAAQARDLSVEGASGNGGDGVQVLGGRSSVENVMATGHGRDGFKIGAYSTDPSESVNTNLWRAINIVSRQNGRHGCLIQHEGAGAAPNNNAGLLMGLDAGFNGGDGLAVSESYDNQLMGVTCQNNTGYGVRMSAQAKGNFLPAPYLEANTAGDLVLEVGADRNQILGVRGGVNNSGYVNDGQENIVIGRYGTVQAVPLHESAEAFQDLRILERTTSGVWRLTKQATTRHLVVELLTSATADLLVTNGGGGAAGLRFGVGANDAAQRSLLRTAPTLNFGSIPANSTVEISVPIAGADAFCEYTVTPIHAIPAGVTWGAYWDGSDVKVRCANVTTSAKTVNGAFTVIARKMV